MGNILNFEEIAVKLVSSISSVGPRLKKMDCRKWEKECTDCQESKISRQVKNPIVKFPLPTDRFLYIYIDLVGPLPNW